MALHVWKKGLLSFSVSDPFATTLGGAGGPRVVSVSFEAWIFGRGHPKVTVTVDLPFDLWTDDHQIKRRAARAAVPAAREAARMLLIGEAEYGVDRDPERRGPYCTVGFQHTKVFDGRERRIVARVDHRLEEGETDEEARDLVTPRLARFMKDLAESIHGALVDPAFERVFGKAA